MNVLKKMYSILYPEEIERMQKALNELLKETELKIEELEKELNLKNVKKALNNINCM